MDQPAAHVVARELQLVAADSGVTFHGRSMEPFLVDGDRLTVTPVGWNDIRPGDVVTYRLDDRFPTLRVVRRGATTATLRGDNWPFQDFTIWPGDVLGRVVARHRAGRTLRSTDAGWALRTRVALADDRLRRLKRAAAAGARRVTAGIGRRLAAWRSPLGERPAGLHVNISSSCNLGCRMCPYLPVHDNDDYVDQMTEETFRRLLPAMPWLPSLHLSGSGEPFFNRRLVRFIELAREVNPSIEVNVTCNGTLLTDQVIRDLVRVKLTRLTISIDGATEATVSAIRIGVNLSKVLAHARRVTAIKQETGSRWPVLRSNYMVGYGSYDELPAFLRIARDVGIQEVNVLDVFTGSDEAVATSLAAAVSRDGGETLRQASKLADTFGIRLTLPFTAHDRCTHPFTPHVSERGGVSPCCYVDYEGRTLMEDGREVRLPKIEYGDLATSTFAELWNAPAYRDLRARDARGDFPGFCRSCHTVRVATSRALHDVMD